MTKPATLSHRRSFFGSEEYDPTITLMQDLITRDLESPDMDDNSYFLQLASEIPVGIFSKNRLWNVLKEDGTTFELLIPTLIVSLEKLLKEVEQQHLINTTNVCHNFNPINFLAHHLHHNNPRYLNVYKMSTYVKLRRITKEFCKLIYDDKRLQILKENEQVKRQEQDSRNQAKNEEMIQRYNALQRQFSEWLLPLQNKLSLKSVKSALHTFVEFSRDVPKEIFESSELDLSLDKISDSYRMLNCNEFSEMLLDYTINMDQEIFNFFFSHLSRCAGAYQYSLNTVQRRAVLANLFMACDESQLGVLDRHRVLSLLEMFWSNTTNDIRAVLNDPTRWPVIEIENSQELIDEVNPEEPEVAVIEKFAEDESIQKSHSEPMVEIEESKQPTDEINSAEPEIKENRSREESISEPVPPEQILSVQDLTESQKNLEPTPPKQKSDPTPEALKVTKAATEPVPPEQILSVQDLTESQKNLEPTPPEQKSDPTPEALKVTKAATEPVPPEQILSAQDLAESQKNLEPTPPKQKSDPTPEALKVTKAATVFSCERPVTAISFAEKVAYEREPTGISFTSVSAFDEDNLNVSQFVQLMETFMGTQHIKEIFDNIVNFVHDNYVESEEEKKERLEKAKLELELAKCKQMTDDLFDKWDNDGAGYLELNKIESVMYNYKDGEEINAVKKAKYNLKARTSDEKLSKGEFQNFVLDVTSNISGQFEYEYFIDYLTDSVELSQLERVRGATRKAWLNSILTVAKTNTTYLSPVFDTIFSIICKDANMHGGGKKVSVYIALLINNHQNSAERGENFLQYMASTPDQAQFVKGQILYRDMKGVSFFCVDKGIPVHVPNVKNHGNIHFWNQARWKTENNGSFLVIPLKDTQKRVFGVLGIDTINDSDERAIFFTHEINFYQGVANAFNIAYHQVEVRKRVVKILESASRWIHRHCIDVCEICVYIVEMCPKSQDVILKKLLTSTQKTNSQSLKKPPRLERKDSLFRDYLFRCVDNSKTISADAYGQHRLACPLRDKEGKVSFVVDISIGSTLKQLPNYENRQLLRMLRLLQVAHQEIMSELAEGEACTVVLAAEQMTEDLRVEVMFDRLLLLDLRENVSKLDMQAYAELRSYTAPPTMIRDVLKAVLSIFYPKESKEGVFEDWTVTRNYINQQLCQKIEQYDPTAMEDLIDVATMEQKLKDIPQGEVAKHGSVPTEHLFNWLFVCISLIEHLKNKKDPIVN